MKLSSRRISHETKLDLNMTPMIDMIFLLLIFFIATAAFVAAERNLDSAIKPKQQVAASAARDLEPAVVDIVRGGAGFVFKVGGRELTTQDELTGVLKQFPYKLDGAFVRVSGDVPFGLAAAAIQACKDADFVTVSYVPMD